MSLKPWMTSTDLIASVKRKIAVPLNQRTFSEEDILAFANEEMMISQVPDLMMYHEEYFVYPQDIPLVVNKTRYAIPERAMGQKLRDIFYVDDNGNLFEMTRINADDKAYWQRESGTMNLMQKYYLEGNDVVLAPITLSQVTGSLRFTYFLRPNQLVTNDHAAISESFYKLITMVNASLVAGDTIEIGDLTFTAVSGSPSALQFQIGASSILSATNLATAINTDGTYSASNSTPATAILQVHFEDYDTDFTASSVGMVVGTQFGIKFNADITDQIVDGTIIDFLQTKPGHKTLGMDLKLSANAVSADSILFDTIDDVPSNFIVGDYIAPQYECIIPQIPPDLHNGLAERVSARILAAQGDLQGLQISEAKIAEIKRSEGTLVDDRVDGSTQKVNQRKSPLSFMRMGIRRRI